MYKRDKGIDFLRFTAIILVINSHMDQFYPIAQLGTGGAIGNALFFMLSSFSLYQERHNINLDFFNYLKKRITRIYPTIWVTIVIIILPIAFFYSITDYEKFNIFKKEFNVYSPLDFLGVIFYPPPAFWFLQTLMLYYLIGYIYKYYFKPPAKLILILILLIIYTIMYYLIEDFTFLVIEQQIEFKIIFYLLIFIFGIELSTINNKIMSHGLYDYIGFLFILIIIYGHKILASKGHLMEWQVIEQISIFPLIFLALKISRSKLVEKIMSRIKASTFISIIATMTLELYVVHGPIRELLLPYLGKFPLNIFVYLPIVIIIAYIVRRISLKVGEALFNIAT